MTRVVGDEEGDGDGGNMARNNDNSLSPSSFDGAIAANETSRSFLSLAFVALLIVEYRER